ncbi:MAG: SBBP repeat-containing protein, partial [Chloroflexi bacterium]|nr:SBBP repeat-containing protein [Chloroflexota bacterium]
MSTRSVCQRFFFVSLVLILSLLLPVDHPPAVAQQPPAVPDQTVRSSPVMFIENVGQFAEDARFQVRGGDGTMWLAEDALWITIMALSEAARPDRDPRAGLPTAQPLAAPETPRTGVNIRLSFPGANAHPRLEAFDRLDTVVSYFLGNDPAQWRPDVPVWGGVRYVDLYPGVDLEITGEGGQMVQRLAVRPGADLSAVRLLVEGADAVALDGDALRLSTAAGEFTIPLLQIEKSSGAAAVQPRGALAFDVAAPFAPAHSNRQSAIANLQSPADSPADLPYATFLGDSSDDEGSGIAVDGAGSAYVTGYTLSSDFPTTPGAFDSSFNGGSYDAFVVKLNPAGSGLAYATFLGGSSDDFGSSIAVDGAGSAYVTGDTNSSDFPTTPGDFDTSYNGGDDAFAVKLNPTGSALAYAIFLGGSGDDYGNAIAVDAAGSAYVMGSPSSSDLPTTPGAFDTSYTGGGIDAFVVKLNPAGSGLAYATFLGGSGDDWGRAIAVDAAGSAYVTG